MINILVVQIFTFKPSPVTDNMWHVFTGLQNTTDFWQREGQVWTSFNNNLFVCVLFEIFHSAEIFVIQVLPKLKFVSHFE